MLTFVESRRQQRQPTRRSVSNKNEKQNGRSDGRLRSLSREHSDANEDETRAFLSDDTSFMAVEEIRLQTFMNWPHYAPVSAVDLARDGFYYLGPPDRVQCAFCRRVLHSWRPGDSVREEHRKVNPRCPFIRGRAHNVPLSAPGAHGQVGRQSGYLPQAARQPAAPVSQGRQPVQPSEALQPSEATASSSSSSSQAVQSYGAMGGDVYSYGTASQSRSGWENVDLPPKARMALLEGSSQPALPMGSSYDVSPGSALPPSSQPLFELPSSKTTGLEGKSIVRSPEPPEESGPAASFPGARPAAATTTPSTSSSPCNRRISVQGLKTGLATFPAASPEAPATFPVASPKEPAIFPSFPGAVNPQRPHRNSDEASMLDANIELLMDSPAVKAVKSMELTVSEEDLRALVCRLWLEQGRGFSALELANILMDMETNNVKVEDVSLLEREGDDNDTPSALRGGGSIAQARPAVSGKSSPSLQTPAAAASSSPASQPLQEGPLSSQSEENNETLTCKVCMDRQVQVTFIPCGHLVCCETCGTRVSECPLCRHYVEGRLKTYLS